MVATIAQLIGKINPKLYASNGKELLKEYKSPDKIPAEKVKAKAITYLESKGFIKFTDAGQEASHTLNYDSSSETLEPVYFFILDLMNDFGLNTEKLIDNFTSSPGSGHFSELGQRATIMQQQGTKLLGDINTVMRSVLNIIYDLKDFKIRLQQYDSLKNKNAGMKNAAVLALKQIWLDKVDINKGNSSVKAMALGQAGFQTLLDAFLFVGNEKDVDNVDLNERVKRILRPRIMEFNDWLKTSEKELRKRYELEKTYLKSQVNSLKLYIRWAKPYLRAASQLEMGESGREPALVKTFNTILLELTLLGKKKIKIHDEVVAGTLPKDVERIKTRDYYSCTLVNFRFRGIPQRVSQQSHYAFGGRADISFSAYALSGDELDKLNELLDESDLSDALKLIEGTTTESLGQLEGEINEFLNETPDEESSMPSDTSNPFVALVGGYNEKPKKSEKKEKKSDKKKVTVGSDNFAEKEYLRPLAAEGAIESTFKFFDIYKKAHGMASYT